MISHSTLLRFKKKIELKKHWSIPTTVVNLHTHTNVIVALSLWLTYPDRMPAI